MPLPAPIPLSRGRRYRRVLTGALSLSLGLLGAAALPVAPAAQAQEATAAAPALAAQAAPAAPATPVTSRAGEVTATLFQWPWKDVASQCTKVLGPAGYTYVQVSPPQENITGSEWWTSYQTVSYKIGNKLGTEAEFKDMVNTCHQAGVKVMADAVINHMTGRDMDKNRGGKGILGTPYEWHRYPGIYEEADDFHSCQQNIGDAYHDRTKVQECDLVGLADLNTGKEKVRQRIADYLNGLTDLGVDALRIDAVKHISVEDMAAIKAKLKKQDVYIQQEVIGSAGEAVSDKEYTGIGKVDEFDYGRHLKQAFSDKLASLKDLPTRSDLLPSEQAHVFVDNWDTERNNSTMTYHWNDVYTLGNIFMLAHPYGDVNVYSGYRFNKDVEAERDKGAPQDAQGLVITPRCQTEDGVGYNDGVFTCVHSWRPITGMVGFRNAVAGAPLRNWYDDGNRLVAFNRGDRGFIALNNYDQARNLELSTGLPDGTYCDVVSGGVSGNACVGTTVEVQGGKAKLSIPKQGAVAIDVASNSLLKAADPTPVSSMRVYLEGTDWSSANIHYAVDGTWTNPPGQAMTASACTGSFYADVKNDGKVVTGLFNRENADWYHASGGGNFTWPATARYISVKNGVATASTTSPCAADLPDEPQSPTPEPPATEIITLAGTFQAQASCPDTENHGGNWEPGCAATRMTQVPGDPDTWTYTSPALTQGTYEAKVTHGGSWDENYGVGGQPKGSNYTFSVPAGKTVTFTYHRSTHLLDISVEGVAPGTGELRAYWVDEHTLAWPVSLLPQGITRDQAVAAGNAGLSYQLLSSADASTTLAAGQAAGQFTRIDLTVTGDLPAETTNARPNLRGYIALSTGSALERAAVEKALASQLTVAQVKDSKVTAATGVQVAPVLDALYAKEAAKAPKGVSFTGGSPAFALWAPTAQAVSLLSWGPDGAGEPTVQTAARQADGRWTVANTDGAIAAGSQYQWRVKVYAPTTGKIESNDVTDPYSVALTLDSKRSVAVDLSSAELAPQQWKSARGPAIRNDSARSIYELHVRDFSIADQTVPEAERGTYKAFTHADSAGMKHLRQLAEAGMNTIHLLPVNDIASIPENRADQQNPQVPQAGPADEAQQAAVTAVDTKDGFNWGYDPYHWMAPEGSYATAANQEGGKRSYEMREMVGALHATGYQVVLDQVYNHTFAAGQDDKSVLDRVVPSYYQRLNANGGVETSTCCSNTATENAMTEQLMIDSVLWWAKQYKIDGFRFDLMGHHSADTMKRLRTALDGLTPEQDGVDGKAIYLYGEGWNFGEVKDNALFTQATQGQLDGTGIGSFNDRLRDGVHKGLLAGKPQDVNSKELIEVGLTGNLKDYQFTDGAHHWTGGDVSYGSGKAGYASQPQESVNYVDAHDKETLFDMAVRHLPVDTPMDQRIRLNTLSLATTALGQSPSFWHAGTDILRSKSLDVDSYNSGDWFNSIDWSLQDNGFGKGLPVAGKNQKDHWDAQRTLLANPALKPNSEQIKQAHAQALDLLKVRSSTPLLTLGTAELVKEKVSFVNPGQSQASPGVITMLVDDTKGADVDKATKRVVVVLNLNDQQVTQKVAGTEGGAFALHAVQAGGADEVVKGSGFEAASGAFTVPARTAAVFVEKQAPEQIQPDGAKPAYVSAVETGKTGTLLVGDWDGDGDVNWAVRVGTRVVFYTENRVDAPVYASISIGRATDEVLVGDWDGNGKDTLALRRSTTVLKQLRLTSAATEPVKVPGITATAKLAVKDGRPDQIVLAE
ncbi:Pullulanase precursor [Actinomyces bovis]|uniref:1,4-alpha-D-glucan glucanohydrolase n=1 Tax=Actinomyces bovis TaxID=1658 RepID=A0ABY1VPH8_9ACTO|nr:alpha-1,6-glucosidase domain-containing protein [Actinomyces bovis]SPT53708.1 Pullulanase precursor [Actinomyces bovis]VEG55847.1 Pullulanase precursor [Actinomyces israelii]